MPDACDICDRGDDAIDVDGDGAPAACDCDDGDGANYPGNLEMCDGQDNNCDGIVDDPSTEGVWLRSMTELGHVHGTPYWEDDLITAESVFGRVDHLLGLTWLHISGELFTLDRGRYVFDVRVRGGSEAHPLDLVVLQLGQLCRNRNRDMEHGRPARQRRLGNPVPLSLSASQETTVSSGSPCRTIRISTGNEATGLTGCEHATNAEILRIAPRSTT